METSVNQRLNDIVNFLIFSKVALDKTDLSKKLGYNASSFSQIINERVPLTDRFVNRLMEFAPNINKDWLLTGEGEMLKVPATVTVYNPTQDERQEVGEALNMSVLPAEVVEEIKEEIKEEEAIPIISSEIATRTDLDIREYIEENAGELEHINPSELLQNPDLAERVMGTSMLPTFAPNDIVFVKFISDTAKIIDGNTYYFDTKTRPTMIRKVKFEPNGKLRLIAKNPSYADIITDRSDINNVAKIIGMLRLTFGDQYDEIEELRKKKARQIDKLVEQNGEALKIIHDLIKK